MLFLPLHIVEIEETGCVDLHAFQIGVAGPEVHILEQRDLGAQLIDERVALAQDFFPFRFIDGGARLIDQGIHFWVVQTGLVGSTDGLAVVNTGEIGQHIAGRIVADGGCVIAFGRGVQGGGQGW